MTFDFGFFLLVYAVVASIFLLPIIIREFVEYLKRKRGG